MRGVDVSSDHQVLVTAVRLQLKRYNTWKTFNAGLPRSYISSPLCAYVAYKASTRAHYLCWSAERCSRRPHVQSFSFIYLATVLLQKSLGQPRFLRPSGVHSRAIMSRVVVCWRSTCPIHRQCLLLTCVEMDSFFAFRRSSSLVIVFDQYTSRIHLRHPFLEDVKFIAGGFGHLP
jgi:hypothetical protein